MLDVVVVDVGVDVIVGCECGFDLFFFDDFEYGVWFWVVLCV